MFLKKMVFQLYVFLSVLFLITPIVAPYAERFMSLGLLWLLFCCYLIGCNSGSGRFYIKRNHFNVTNFLTKRSGLLILMFAIVIFILKMYSISFYTGNSPLTGIINYISGSSTYRQYQDYFESANLSSFSLKKIPFILINALFKLSYLYLLFYVTLCEIKRGKIPVVMAVILLGIGFLISALCRGTFFEIFEFFLSIGFAFLMKYYSIHKTIVLKKSTYVILSLFAILLCIGFIINKSFRAVGSTDDVLFYATDLSGLSENTGSFMATHFPYLSLLLCHISGYFLFGLYLISVTIDFLWISSVSNFCAALLPYGYTAFGSLTSSEIVCSKHIYCGATWTPDVLFYVDNMGLLLTMVLLILLGRLSAKLCNTAFGGNISIVVYVFIYFIFLFLFSLPIGNFIATSSENILTVAATGYLLFKSVRTNARI